MSAAALLDEKIAAAVLRIVKTKGWGGVGVVSVARATKVPVNTLKERFFDPYQFAVVVVEDITRRALQNLQQKQGISRDVFFDLLMARFDELQKDRKAIMAIAQAAQKDAKVFAEVTCAVWGGVAQSLDHICPNLPAKTAFVACLSISYASAFRVWLKDGSSDMTTTMAALDRALRLGEKATGWFAQLISDDAPDPCQR